MTRTPCSTPTSVDDAPAGARFDSRSARFAGTVTDSLGSDHPGVYRRHSAGLADSWRVATAIVCQGPAATVSRGPGVARWNRRLHARERPRGALLPDHDRHLPPSGPAPSGARALERAADAASVSGHRTALAGAQPRALGDARALARALRADEPRARGVAAAVVPPLHRPARAPHPDARGARLARGRRGP